MPGSGCSVPCALFRLTEYEVICYEKFVFNSLKRCYLWVFFLHFVFSLLFASFNFTKLQFIVVSSLMYFDSHSRSLFNDGFHNIYSVLSLFGVLGFIAFTTYSVSCWFRMLGSGCFVPGAWSLVLHSRCSVPGALFVVFFHLVFSLLFAVFNSTKVNRS